MAKGKCNICGNIGELASYWDFEKNQFMLSCVECVSLPETAKTETLFMVLKEVLEEIDRLEISLSCRHKIEDAINRREIFR